MVGGQGFAVVLVGQKRDVHMRLVADAEEDGKRWEGAMGKRGEEVGRSWIRTSEGVSQQIYSLPRLATSVSARERERLAKKRCGVKRVPVEKYRVWTPFRQFECSMKMSLFVILAQIFLVTLILAEEVKLDRAKALEELKVIEQKNETLTQDLLTKSARYLNEAGSDKLKAGQVYLESYRNVEFGRAQDGETRFQQWRVENKEKIASLDFTTAAQLHVQYVALVCREALGEKEAPKAGEWGLYWENLFKSREIAESPGDLTEAKVPMAKKGLAGRKQKKETGNDFDRPVLESPLVRDRQIQGFLEGVQEAKLSSASVGPIFNQVVRPHLRKAKSRDLMRLWDLRIAAMDEDVEKEVKTLGADDYKILKRPELMWERADDLEKIGERESAWAQKMGILRANPYHPKLSNWIEDLKQALGEGSPALPEKAP